MNTSFICQDLQELENALENIKKMNPKSFPIKIILNSLHNDQKDQHIQNSGIECEEKEVLHDKVDDRMRQIPRIQTSSVKSPLSQKHIDSTIRKEIDDFYLHYYYDRREEKKKLMKQAEGLKVTARLKDEKIILEGEKSGVESLFKIITSLHYQLSPEMKWDKADCARRTSFFEKVKDETKTEDRLYPRGTDTVNLIIYGRSKEKIEYCVQQINFIADRIAVLLTIPGKNTHKNEMEKICTFFEFAFIQPIKEQLQRKKVQIEFKRFENQINQDKVFLFVDNKDEFTNILNQLSQEMSSLCFLNILQDVTNPVELEPTSVQNIQKGSLNIFCLNDFSYILIASRDVMRKQLKKLFTKKFFHMQTLRFQFKGKEFDTQEKSKQLSVLKSLVFDSQRDKKMYLLFQQYGIYSFRFKGICADVEKILGKLEEISKGLLLTKDDDFYGHQEATKNEKIQKEEMKLQNQEITSDDQISNLQEVTHEFSKIDLINDSKN